MLSLLTKDQKYFTIAQLSEGRQNLYKDRLYTTMNQNIVQMAIQPPRMAKPRQVQKSHAELAHEISEIFHNCEIVRRPAEFIQSMFGVGIHNYHQ
jgi:hypothetical protein